MWKIGVVSTMNSEFLGIDSFVVVYINKFAWHRMYVFQ